ncbi:TPA: hypothetical protein ACH3X1_014218 [Trebouxia sp. C0004]
MLNSVGQQDRSASPARRNGLDADTLGQTSIVQKRLRSPRPTKKRQGQGPSSERVLDSAVATCSYGDDAAQGLSQLSDLVILDASQDANLSQDFPAEVASHFPSQEGQDAGPPSDSQIMLEAPPSQPDIPLATLAVSRPQADPPHEQPPEIVQPFPHFALPVQQQMVPQRLAGMGSPAVQNLEESQQPLHPKSRATRRGPMDEMRQLVRILVKVIPHSVALISSSEEGGGGNRISEDQIKSYLDEALGEAPRPLWGLPRGWGDYCAILFSWVVEPRAISIDQAMRCAKREPGRSWEALESELNKLGLYPSTWPLPLSRQGLISAAQNPVHQPVPTGPVAIKKQPAYHGPENSSAIKIEKGSRRKVSSGTPAAPHPTAADIELDRLSEAELWQRVVRLIEAAKRKQGTSTAEDAMAVSNAQLKAQKLVQEFAISRSSFLPSLPAGIPGPMVLGPLGGPVGPGSAEQQMALVPVMLPQPDGSYMAAYQVQPVPLGAQGGPADFTGLGGGAVIAAPPGAMNLLVQPCTSSSSFQCVQHQPRPMHTGLPAQGLTPPQGRCIAKPQPIRPRIGALPASAAPPASVMNGFHDGHRPRSASPSTEDNEEEQRDFDIGSILRPTPIKPESVRRIGDSQEGPSQALPIHSLHTPDLAALQGSQGIATSLSVLQNNLQTHGWQHADGASQQSGPGPNSAAPMLGHSQQGSQQGHVPAQPQNGAALHADHMTHPFDQSFGLSQHQLQQSQQGSQTWDSGSQPMPTASGSASQQHTRPPKRKLPFSTGLQPDLKRQSPGPAPAEMPAQHSQSSDPVSSTSAAHEPDRERSSASAFASPQKSPVGHSKAQLMSPSLLLVSHQDSPASVKSPGQQPLHASSAAPLPSQWSPAVSMLH